MLLTRTVVVAAITAFGLFAADRSLGTWKRNVERTKYDQGSPPSNPIVSQTMTREAVDGGVRIITKGARKDGTPISTTVVLKYDGKPVRAQGTGSNYDTVSIKQVDENTFTSEMTKTGGKYRTSGRWTVSADGKTMTSTQKGTDPDGKPIGFTVVYDKQ